MWVRTQGVPWVAVAALACVLLAPVASDLWRVWRHNPELGFGPWVPVLAAALVWGRWRHLPPVHPGSARSLYLLIPASLLYLLGAGGDIELFRAVGAVGLLGGAVWLCASGAVLRAVSGAVGFLLLAIPWPTSITERLAFPLQLTSATYAALITGIVGQRVERAGVHLSALPPAGEHPLYSILVSRQCSGLTSLGVLLTLAYLIACLTPVRWPLRAAVVAAALPIAVFANAVRLSFILLAGARFSVQAARWVHDHETPVLLLICGVLLVGIRALLLGAFPPGAEQDVPPPLVRPPAAAPRTDRLPAPLALAGLLALLVAGRAWASRGERIPLTGPDFLRGLELPYRDWRVTEGSLTETERDALEPEAALSRLYESTEGERVELTVIAGRHRRTIHSPGSCFVGCGWERLLEREHGVQLADRRLPTTRSLMTLGPQRMLMTYFFTDGQFSSSTLLSFQAAELFRRFQPQVPMQAVVRVVVPVTSTTVAAEHLSDDFAAAVFPRVIRTIVRRRG